MSTDDAINLRQDRRQWLKASATVLGASLLPLPVVPTETLQTESKPANIEHDKTESKSAVHFFTPAQHALVEELSETIIPADDHSGGAKAAKVADYIDRVLREGFDENQKALWRDGLHLIDVMSLHYNGKSFVHAAAEDRISLLTILSNHLEMTDLPEVRFFIELKRITAQGYYTSKIGIHDELQYKGNRILQEFVGCDDQDPAKAS
jgi:glucoside 3-dehydrogenase (cytochrome c) hitch-hiker subunit